MSVVSSQRGEAKAQFLADTKKALLMTYRMTAKFPKNYRWQILDSMLELANKAYDEVRYANEYYICKSSVQSEYEQRKIHLQEARGALSALSSKISLLYEIIDDGTNFLGSKEKYSKQFAVWTELVTTAKSRIVALIKSDVKHWEQVKSC